MSKTTKIITITIFIALIISAILYFYFDSVRIRFSNQPFYSCPKDSELKISGDYKWIDCMPSFSKANKYCDLKYQKWIEENCKGISFTE